MKKWRELHRALRAIGIYHSDLHYNNIARKGKRLVCIDFGIEGCHKGKPSKEADSDHDLEFCPTCGDLF